MTTFILSLPGGSKKEAKTNCAQNAVEGLRLDESQTPRAPVNLRGGAASKSIQPQTTRPKPETNRPHPLAERPHPLADMSVVVNPVVSLHTLVRIYIYDFSHILHFRNSAQCIV